MDSNIHMPFFLRLVRLGFWIEPSRSASVAGGLVGEAFATALCIIKSIKFSQELSLAKALAFFIRERVAVAM